MALVTLTTDFGTDDGYVGAMKGVLHTWAPGVTIVDISHGVPPRDVAAGAFVLAQAAPLYPPGTVHVAVVDPGVGGARADVIVEANGSFFVGPDNGVLSLAARGARRVHAIASPMFRRDPVSPTFHGRDVFAPAAARLAAGWRPEEAGPALEALQELLAGAPGDGELSRSLVVHVDRWGNLITASEGAALAGVSNVRVAVDGGPAREVRVVRTFADGSPGELIAYVGSGGQIELGVRDGSAAAAIGVGRGARLGLVPVGGRT